MGFGSSSMLTPHLQRGPLQTEHVLRYTVSLNAVRERVARAVPVRAAQGKESACNGCGLRHMSSVHWKETPRVMELY